MDSHIRNRSRWLTPLLALVAAFGGYMDHDPTGPLRAGDAPTRDGVTAQAFTGNIRIGVVPAASSVAVGSSGAFVVRSKATGREVARGNDASVW